MVWMGFDVIQIKNELSLRFSYLPKLLNSMVEVINAFRSIGIDAKPEVALLTSPSEFDRSKNKGQKNLLTQKNLPTHKIARIENHHKAFWKLPKPCS